MVAKVAPAAGDDDGDEKEEGEEKRDTGWKPSPLTNTGGGSGERT